MPEHHFKPGTTYRAIDFGPDGPSSDRHLQDYEETLGIHREDLRDRKILDLGSGLFESLGKDLEREGITTNVVSLNPDLAQDSLLRSFRDPNSERSAVAALAQQLPFKNESFDLVVGLESVTRYVDPGTHLGDAKKWASEIVRVLKYGGEARLWPILEMDQFVSGKPALDELCASIEQLGATTTLEAWQDDQDEKYKGYRLIIRKPKQEGTQEHK